MERRQMSFLETLGAKLPTAYLRELYFDSFAQTEGVYTPSPEVESLYRNLCRGNRDRATQSGIEMIRFHSAFIQKILTYEELSRMIWYFEPNTHHISYMLTQGGKNRDLLHVARRFDAIGDRLEMVDEWNEEVVWKSLEDYYKGVVKAPIIVTRRPLGARPDGGLHIIDGVHRSLALALYFGETGKVPSQQILIA